MGELSVSIHALGQLLVSRVAEPPVVHAPNHAEPALLVDIHKSYLTSGKESGFQLVSQFQALPGFTILLGHSGAGKTTLLRCIAGLSSMQKGRIAIGQRVLFDSQRSVNLEPRQRNIAYVFQNLALFPHLSVLENVTYGLRKLDMTEQRRRAKSIMESFGIGHLAARLPREVSGGEQQRVALARALVTEPVALLLDEPLSSLDGCTKARIMEDLRTWNARRRIPILYVTHDRHEVLELGEHVVTLAEGRMTSGVLPVHLWTQASSQALTDPCENRFEATIKAVNETEGTMTCRLSGTTLELRAPYARVSVGQRVALRITASPILPR